MGALVNLVIGFIMGLLSNQIEAPNTAHYEVQKDSLELFEILEDRQVKLDS